MFILLIEYFETREKMKVTLITCKVIKTETQKIWMFSNIF